MVQLGTRLRTDAQVAAGLTITVRYADGSTTTRTRALPEATRQLTFDHTIDKTLLIEAVQDRARQRYGTDVIKPALLG
ncbi:DinB/UmuC family translesion DNA polymerase [Streptomyces anulatus]|uniref:DinB/UmuC family translesion DNA polymerase n=1 Tax=Streptomyces anulatus TaxID=1892 RepID=UPI003688D65D